MTMTLLHFLQFLLSNKDQKIGKLGTTIPHIHIPMERKLNMHVHTINVDPCAHFHAHSALNIYIDAPKLLVFMLAKLPMPIEKTHNSKFGVQFLILIHSYNLALNAYKCMPLLQAYVKYLVKILVQGLYPRLYRDRFDTL